MLHWLQNGGKMSCRYFKTDPPSYSLGVQQSSVRTKCDAVTNMRPPVVRLPWLVAQRFCCRFLRHSAAVSHVSVIWHQQHRNTANYPAICHTVLSRGAELSWLWRLWMLKPTPSMHIKLDDEPTILIYLSFFLKGDMDDNFRKMIHCIFFKWFIFVVLHMLKIISSL